MTFIRDVVRSLPRREILLDKPSRPPVLIWSDAMYETKAAEPAAGGFVALFPAESEPGLEEEILSLTRRDKQLLRSWTCRHDAKAVHRTARDPAVGRVVEETTGYTRGSEVGDRDRYRPSLKP